MEYQIECNECKGKCRVDYVVNGNESELDNCETCKGVGELTINTNELLEEQLGELYSGIEMIYYKLRKHGFSESEISKFIDKEVKRIKHENKNY